MGRSPLHRAAALHFIHFITTAAGNRGPNLFRGMRDYYRVVMFGKPKFQIAGQGQGQSKRQRHTGVTGATWSGLNSIGEYAIIMFLAGYVRYPGDQAQMFGDIRHSTLSVAVA